MQTKIAIAVVLLTVVLTAYLARTEVLPPIVILTLGLLILIEGTKIFVILKRFSVLHGKNRVLLVTLSEVISFIVSVVVLALLATPTRPENHVAAITFCAHFMVLRFVACLILWQPMWTADDKVDDTTPKE